MLKKNLFSVIYVITEQKLPDLFLDINNKVIYYRGVDNKQEKRLGNHSQNGIPGFILYFPLEPSYGYLTFEGNGKIPLGR